MIRVIDHVNISTENLAQTRDFFVDELGLEDGPRPDFGVPGHWLYADGGRLLTPHSTPVIPAEARFFDTKTTKGTKTTKKADLSA